jgi:hypothetical protein
VVRTVEPCSSHERTEEICVWVRDFLVGYRVVLRKFKYLLWCHKWFFFVFFGSVMISVCFLF